MEVKSDILSQQVKLIYIKNRLKTFFSFIFFGLVFVFTIVFFCLPQAKAKSMVYKSDLYGLNSNKFSKDDIYSVLGIKSDDYNIFFNANSLKKKLEQAPFVNDKQNCEIKVSPFYFSVSFNDIFPVGTYDDNVYLSNGVILKDDMDLTDEKNKYAYDNYKEFLDDKYKALLPTISIEGDSSILDITPIISEINYSFFPILSTELLESNILKDITFRNVEGKKNGFILRFVLNENLKNELSLYVRTSANLLSQLTRDMLLKGASVIFNNDSKSNKANVLFSRVGESQRLAFYNDEE